MSIVSDSDLASFGQLAIDLAFRDTCEILRVSSVDDGQGGQTPTWSVIATVPCLVTDDQAPRTLIVAQQVTARITKNIALPRETDITRADKIHVTGNAQHTGIYTILDLQDPTSYEVIRRVVALREEVGD